MSDKTEAPAESTPAETAPAEAAPAAPQPNRINLFVPIKREGGDITAITLRRPNAGELRGLKVGELFNADVNSVIALLPRISDPFIAEHEAAGLDPIDLGEIAGTISGFFTTPTQKAAMMKALGASG